MALELIMNPEPDAGTRDRLLAHATRNRFLDWNLDFTVEGGPVRRAVKLHVTREAIEGAGYAAPIMAGGSGLGFDPFLTIEDEDGALIALQHCRNHIGFEHHFGLLKSYRGALWLLSMGSEEIHGGAAAKIVEGDVGVTRIHGQIADSLRENGDLCEEGKLYEGEFNVSVEEEPILVSSPWHSEVGSYAPGFGSDEQRTADAAVDRSVTNIIEDHLAEIAESPEVG